jgi:hypothetical protein
MAWFPGAAQHPGHECKQTYCGTVINSSTVAVRILEIDAAAAIPIVELAIVQAPRRAAVGKPRLFDAVENGIEFGIVHVERIMMTFKSLVRVEEERERLVDAYRREMSFCFFEGEAKNLRKKSRRRFLIARRNNGVIERDGH